MIAYLLIAGIAVAYLAVVIACGKVFERISRSYPPESSYDRFLTEHSDRAPLPDHPLTAIDSERVERAKFRHTTRYGRRP